MIVPPSLSCMDVQELGQTDKADQYAAAASRETGCYCTAHGRAGQTGRLD